MVGRIEGRGQPGRLSSRASGSVCLAISRPQSREEDARPRETRYFGHRFGSEDEKLAGYRAQPFQDQKWVWRVVEESIAPHHVMGSDATDHVRVVQVTLDKPHPGPAPGVLGQKPRRCVHHIEARYRPRAALFGQEGNRPLDPPHAADVGKAPIRRKAFYQMLTAGQSTAGQPLPGAGYPYPGSQELMHGGRFIARIGTVSRC